jgi:hypothetical protein
MKDKLSQQDLAAFEEHEKELQEEEESITHAIKDFKLDTMSRIELERKAARWMLELDALTYVTNQSLTIRKKSSMDSLRFWLSNIVTDAFGELNKFGKVIHKGRSIINTLIAKLDRPRNGAIKPTPAELEAFKLNYQEKLKRDGKDGSYGWKKEAARHYGYSARQISRILEQK